MPKSFNVLIVEDDRYACDFMTMLLIRDWRTRVLAQVSSAEGLQQVLAQQKSQELDVILLDTEVPNQPDWLQALDPIVRLKPPGCVVLCTGTQPQPHILRQIIHGI